MGIPSPDAIDQLLLRKIKILFQSVFTETQPSRKCPYITYEDFARDLDTKHDICINAVGLMAYETATRTSRPGRPSLAQAEKDRAARATTGSRRLASSRRRAVPSGGNARSRRETAIFSDSEEEEDAGTIIQTSSFVRNLLPRTTAARNSSVNSMIHELFDAPDQPSEILLGGASRGPSPRLPTYEELWTALQLDLPFPRESVETLADLVVAINESGFSDTQFLAGDLRALCAELQERDPGIASRIRNAIRRRPEVGSQFARPAFPPATGLGPHTVNSVEPRVTTVSMGGRGVQEGEPDAQIERYRNLVREATEARERRNRPTPLTRPRSEEETEADHEERRLRQQELNRLRLRDSLDRFRAQSRATVSGRRQTSSDSSAGTTDNSLLASILGDDSGVDSTSDVPSFASPVDGTPATSVGHSPTSGHACPAEGGESAADDAEQSTTTDMAPSRPPTTAQLAESAAALVRGRRIISGLQSRAVRH